MVKYSKGDYTNCRCNICEIVDEDDEIVCNVVTEDFEKVVAILEENERLKEENKTLADGLTAYFESKIKGVMWND